MSLKSRLLKRKQWYTLEDAARRLSIELDEHATSRDVLQLALDGEIGLCVMLHHQSAKKVVSVTERENYCLNVSDSGNEPQTIPAIHNGPSLGVDDKEHRYLDGIYEISDINGAKSKMLSLKVLEDPWEAAYAGFWTVEETGGDGSVWLIFEKDMDAPMIEWPSEKTLMVLRTDIEGFLESVDMEESEGKEVGDDLRVFEALGLLAETFSHKQGPQYQVAGKRPNSAQIAEAMSQQADGVYGMGKSKLQRLLSAALDAWHEKRQ